MCEIVVFTAKKVVTCAHRLKPNPLSAEASAIADKLPALVQPQKDGAVATNLGGDVEEEVQAGGGGQDTPVVPGGRA